MFFFSCASIGTAEHGTSRTSPQLSPGTNDYYKNLVQQDFDMLNWDDWFTMYEFATSGNDLQFYGRKV